MSANSNNRGRPRFFDRRKQGKQLSTRVTGRDLDTKAIRGSVCPPQYHANPSVIRRLRFFTNVPTGGATLVITPNQLGLADGNGYLGSSTLRYNQVRLISAEVWLAYSLSGTGPGLNTVSITESSTDYVVEDIGNPGTDYAHVAIRMSLATRSTWSSTTASTSLAVAAGGSASANTGQMITDVVVEFC